MLRSMNQGKGAAPTSQKPHLVSLQNPDNSHSNLDRRERSNHFLAFPIFDCGVAKMAAVEMREKREMSAICMTVRV